MLCFQIARLCDVGTFFVTPPALRSLIIFLSSLLSLRAFWPIGVASALGLIFILGRLDSHLYLDLDFDAYLLGGLIGFGVISVD